MKAINLFLICLLTAAGTPIGAQEVRSGSDAAVRAELPPVVAEEVTLRLNNPNTAVQEGDLTFATGTRQAGNLAVLDGNLSLAGSIEGDLTVVNGNLTFLPGATVSGSVLVVGGSIENSEVGRVGGEISTHSERYVYERAAGRIRHLRAPRLAGARSEIPGSSDFLIATGKSYNRVEGLPIAFGPRLQTDSSNPLRLQALGIYRSESGLTWDVEQMGYFVRAEQFMGGRQEYRVGATLQSVIDPIEEWQLTDLETGLATFLFHRDYRDHFERTGWSAFLNWEPLNSPLLVQVEGRWEKHELKATGSPWSVFRNAERWRPQPVVAEGRLGSVLLLGEYDTRSSPWNPATGWLARGQLEQALQVELAYPATLPFAAPAVNGILEQPEYGRFLTGFLDLRRYNRINADSRLNLRLVTGGSLQGEPLPPQFQHALGGEGSLPGYPLFVNDCGARSSTVSLVRFRDSETDEPFFPQYGCDAFGLIQAEFRGKLAFRFRWDGGPWSEDEAESEEIWDFGWDMAPDWALFVDAGRGWTFSERPDEEMDVNVGVGLLLDRIGLYLAVPVAGGGGANVFMRLGPRF